jgi:7-carboxy-7-deazaguanine synthase
MAYSIKEVYYTLQGEGFHTGRAAVFVRFSGCNLWTGREQDREGAVCTFCDTDFVGTNGPGGGKFSSAEALARHVRGIWDEVAPPSERAFIVCTGGEPFLQLDETLIEAFHTANMEVAVETNGTLKAPEGLDWICVSPKADAPLLQTSGHELKLVWYQEKAPPERFSELAFEHFYLQPMDGPDAVRFTKEATAYCLKHPTWKLSLQTHKMLGIP